MYFFKNSKNQFFKKNKNMYFFKNSINLSTSISFVNEIYFSSLFGIQLIIPGIFDPIAEVLLSPRFLIKICESYPEK